jgi:hypothetical protein
LDIIIYNKRQKIQTKNLLKRDSDPACQHSRRPAASPTAAGGGGVRKQLFVMDPLAEEICC